MMMMIIIIDVIMMMYYECLQAFIILNTPIYNPHIFSLQESSLVIAGYPTGELKARFFYNSKGDADLSSRP